MLEIYEFLQRQFKRLDESKKDNYLHQAILFKKFSDGFIESYLLEKYDTTHIVENTVHQFFKGIDL